MTRDPQCPRCRKVTTVERLPWRIGSGMADCFCVDCDLVFSDSPDVGESPASSVERPSLTALPTPQRPALRLLGDGDDAA